MRDLIGKYNRNRKTIWIVLGSAIAIYSLFRIINSYFAKDAILSTQKQYGSTVHSSKDNEEFYETNYAVISEEKINNSTNKKITNFIDSFISYCNNKQYENAYNLLSDDCKEVVFHNEILEFKNDYVDEIFKDKKTFNYQLWDYNDDRYIYKVELKEDALDTGKTSSTSFSDYYTVIEQEEKLLLNISDFIERKNLNISKKENNVEFVIESEEIFMEYVNIKAKITNYNREKIIIDSGKSGKATYVEDEKGIKYISYLFEKNNEELMFNGGVKKELNIKFIKEYKKDRPVVLIAFTDVVLNYGNENEKISQINIDLGNR